MSEIWLPIPSLKNQYEASDLGRIRSIDRVSELINQFGPCLRPIKGRIIRQTLNSGTCPYMTVSPCVDAVVKTKLVHLLIAEVFHPNPENKPQVNHKNGIKTDNRADNLERATRSENQIHSYAIGLATHVGESNTQSKLTEAQALEILRSSSRNSDLARYFGVSPSTICDIQRRRSWSHLTP